MNADEEIGLFTKADKVLLDEDEDSAGIDERKHAQLIDAISALDGRKSSKLSHRTVPVGKVSEFNFSSKPDGSKVKISQLIGSLKETTTHGELKKQLTSIKSKKKNRTVPKPLPKPEAERIHRSLGYQSTVNDVSKWESVVQENRRSDQIVYPLERPSIQVYNVTSDEYVKRFKARTPLELEVARLLGTSESVLDHTQELTKAEERALKAMSLKEAQARRAELQKYRMLLSYKEAKARRQKRIKSKSYHRHLKRSRLKEEEKSIEHMRKNDPETYAEKLQELDRQRIQERMSLKHRGGSKFARKQMVFGKHNDQTRQSVQDMIQKNKELTKKIQPPNEDIESDSDPDDAPQTFSPFMTTEDIPSKRYNPWMTANPLKSSDTLMRDVPGAGHDVVPLEDKRKDIAGTTSEIKQHGPGSSDDTFTSLNDSHEKIMADVVVNHVNERTSVIKSTENKSRSLVGETDSTQKIADKKRKRKKDSANPVNSTEIMDNIKKSKRKKGQKKGEIKIDGNIITNADDNDNDIADNNEEIIETSRRKASAIASVDEIENIFNLAEQRVEAERQLSKIELNIKIKKSNRRKHQEKGETKSDTKIVKNTDDETDEKNEGNIETSMRIQTLDDVDEYLANVDNDQDVSNDSGQVKQGENEKTDVRKMGGNDSEEIYIDPKKLFTIQTKIRNSHTPSMITADADDNIDNQDDETQQRMTIAQAFADDDVIAEFQEEKEMLVSGETPKDIDLTLPGWGSWTGGGITPSEKKQERFIVKAPVGRRRKDLHLGHVIISEKKDVAISKHRVSTLPFPYLDTQQFERSIRTPIGPLWNPETTFRELTKPKVVTMSGQIIAPINKNALVNANDTNADITFGEKSNDVKTQSRNAHGVKTGGERKK